MDKAADLWNSENPEIQVKLEKIPSGSAGGYAKIHSALKADQAPDLAQVEYQVIPEFLLEDGLVDLKPLGVEKHNGDFVDWQWEQGDGTVSVQSYSGNDRPPISSQMLPDTNSGGMELTLNESSPSRMTNTHISRFRPPITTTPGCTRRRRSPVSQHW